MCENVSFLFKAVCTERKGTWFSLLPFKSTSHLDRLGDITDGAGVQPNQPSHFSHNGLSVFKPAEQAVKGQQHYSVTKLDINIHAKTLE